MPWAIEAEELTKSYPTTPDWRGILSRSRSTRLALDRVSLSVKEGELFGMLGPNGAGKTTLIKLLSTLVIPTSGSARVNGFELKDELQVRASIGLCASEERSFAWRLDGIQNLEFFATLQGLPPRLARERSREIFQQMGLNEMGNLRVQAYSTGMRQRLSIARALLHRPRLLFLDEPTKGLDPPTTRRLHEIIRRLAQEQGITIFLTTHDLDEAEELCDRVAVLNHGRLAGCGSIDGLRSSLGMEERYHLTVDGLDPSRSAGLEQITNGMDVTPVDDGDGFSTQLELSFPKDGAVLDRVLQAVRTEYRAEIISISSQAASLETIFDQLTGSSLPLPFQGPSNSQGGESKKQTASIPPAPNTSFAPPPPAHPPSIFQVFLAFLKRDYLVEASYRLSFLIQFGSVIFNLVMFFFLARLIGETGSRILTAYGGNYFAFLLIGIAFSEYFGVSLSSFTGSLRQFQTTGTLEALLVTPIQASVLILASAQWSYMMTTIRCVFYLLAGALFFGFPLGNSNIPAALVVFILSILSFSSLGILAASFIMVLKRGDPLTWAVNSLFTLLGGVFYPVSVLPAWLQTISALIPVTYALQGLRRALLQAVPLSGLRTELLVLSLFCITLLPASLSIFGWSVRRAKTEGSLGHY